MIDAFKNLAAGAKRDVAVSERHELEQLIQTARAERAGLDAALVSLRERSASLTPIARSFEHLTQTMAGAATKLDEIGERLAALDGRTRELEQLGGPIQDLQDRVRQTEQSFLEASRLDGEARKHREAIDELSVQAHQAQASLGALKDEHAAFEELRGQLRSTQAELEQFRGMTGGLTEEWARIGATSRTAREDSSAAVAAIREAEKKLGPLAQLQALGEDTDERLVALNNLAERVSLKTTAIESQQQTVEHALVQSNRVQEMVRSMEQQIARLSEGMRRAATAEETLARLETLSTETTQRLEGAARLHAETEQQAATLEKRAGSVLESLHAQLEILAIDRKAVDGVDERLRLLDGALGRAEARMGALAGQEKDLAGIARGIESVSRRFEGLLAQSDELAGRQLALDRLHEQLADVDALAKKTETIKNGLRGELDVVQSRQRETIAQTQACEDQLLRVERMFKQLEERRALITVAERKLAGVEARVAEIQQANDDLERRHEAIASREQLVNAIKHEVETVHLISARSRADLDYVSQHRGEVSALKVQVDHLLSRLADANLEQAIRQLSLQAEQPDDVKT